MQLVPDRYKRTCFARDEITVQGQCHSKDIPGLLLLQEAGKPPRGLGAHRQPTFVS